MLLASVHVALDGLDSIAPHREPGRSDVRLMSGISGLSFDSSFLFSVLLFYLSPVAVSVLMCFGLWLFF